jgi:hypothetical protein
MSDDIIYRPSEWQQAFHDTVGQGIDEVLGAGSAGPGKTLCLTMDIMDQVAVEHERCTDPNHAFPLIWGTSAGWALHLRRTVKMLKQTIALSHRMFRAVDPGATWSESETTWTFSSGLKYQFGHCKDPHDYEQYMSSAFTAIYFDELTGFEEEQYDQISTRLRSDDPVLSKMLRIRSMSNPLMRTEGESFSVKDANWVRKRFVDPCREGNVIFKRKLTRADGTHSYTKWVYMPAKLSMNPNKAFVAQYELQLLKQKPHIRAALLDGNWYITVGSFFAEYWKERMHIVRPFRVSSEWRIFRSMDWGFKAPGCIHWFALDDENTLYVIYELRFQGKTADEVAAMVQATEELLGFWDERGKCSRITGPADTQLWEQRGESGENKAESFRKKGVMWLPADKKSRQTNAQHLIKRLTDHEEETKTPGIVFFTSCKWIIQVLPSIQTNPQNTEEPMDGGDDHPYDSCVYGCAYASKGKAAIPPMRPLKSEWDDEEVGPLQKRAGQLGYGQELC